MSELHVYKGETVFPVSGICGMIDTEAHLDLHASLRGPCTLADAVLRLIRSNAAFGSLWLQS